MINSGWWNVGDCKFVRVYIVPFFFLVSSADFMLMPLSGYKICRYLSFPPSFKKRN